MSVLEYIVVGFVSGVSGVLVLLLIRGVGRWWADYNAALTLPKTDAWARRPKSED